MTETELRSLVREVVARRMGENIPEALRPATTVQMHASHTLLPLLRGADGDGACLIEPAVRCNHCGYCLSFGH